MDFRGHRLTQEISPSAENVELAHQLIESFTWADTPEGHVYWEARFWALLGVPAAPETAGSTNL